MSAVLIMAKAPLPGTVKTRLHPLLDPTRCARLQATLIRHTAALTPEIATYLAVDPPHQQAAVGELVPSWVRLLAQRGRHLGQRLTAAVNQVFTLDPGPLLIIGTDAPTLTADVLAQAFAALETADVVLGPALDGGYYLIGMRHPLVCLFGIDPALWSGDQVLAATVNAAGDAKLRVALLPQLRDLDTPADAAALLIDPLLPPRIAEVLRPAARTVHQ